MTAEELLKTHPKTREILRQWFMDKLLKSIKSTINLKVSERFKQDLVEKGVPDESLILILDENPHALFDVFDENDIFINTPFLADFFSYNIINYNDVDYVTDVKYYATRKEAERQAVEEAIDLLEAIT